MELIVLMSESAFAPAATAGAGRQHNVGDVRRELHDDRNRCRLHHPARDLLAILRHLANGAAHAALAHAVRAAVVQFDAVRAGVFDALDDLPPRFGLRLDHGGDDDRAIGPGALDLGNFAQVDFNRPVGDQLDVVDGQHALAAVVPGAVAIGDVEHRSADGLPHRAAPAGFKGPVNLRAGVGGRGRGQPERIGRLDAGEVDAKVCHKISRKAVFSPVIAKPASSVNNPILSQG